MGGNRLSLRRWSAERMAGFGYTGTRTLALLLGAAFLAGSFLSAASTADGLRVAGSPWWGFLVFPIALLSIGSILIAFSVSGGTASHPKVMGLTVFLIVIGAGLGIMALLLSSALFYGCAPSECSTDTPVPANNLSIAGNLGIVGLGILAIGGICFGLSRFLPANTALTPNAKPSKGFKQ